MPTVQFGHHQVHYQLVGEADRPVITFLNGLTQNANLWTSYADYFVPRGYRVLAYDMLGQGRSSKPVIDIPLADHADMLARPARRAEDRQDPPGEHLLRRHHRPRFCDPLRQAPAQPGRR